MYIYIYIYMDPSSGVLGLVLQGFKASWFGAFGLKWLSAAI